MQKEHGKLLK